MDHFETIGIHLRIWHNLGMDAFSQVAALREGELLEYLSQLCPRIALDRRLQKFLSGIVLESEAAPMPKMKRTIGHHALELHIVGFLICSHLTWRRMKIVRHF